MAVEWRAGATSSFNCSLCQAGTYSTGSGHKSLCSFQILCHPQTTHFHQSYQFKCHCLAGHSATWLHSCCDGARSVARYTKKSDWCAGASTGLNCSLCQAGTYSTGSGRKFSCGFQGLLYPRTNHFSRFDVSLQTFSILVALVLGHCTLHSSLYKETG
jgi:hypothetical protein